MFRDTKEELKRLEEELLAEENLPPKTQSKEEITEETLSDLMGGDTVVIRQEDLEKAMKEKSARRGRYVGKYEAYNTDKADADLDTYREAVRSPKKDRSILFLSILALVLLAAIFGVLIWWLVRFRGLIG